MTASPLSNGELVIDRARWRCGSVDTYVTKIHGHGRGSTRLLNPNTGLLCCLGIYAEAVGVPRHLLEGIGEPASVEGGVPGLTETPLNVEDKRNQRINTQYAKTQMTTNDDHHITNEERERRLIAEAARHGETWRFVGEYTAHVS